MQTQRPEQPNHPAHSPRGITAEALARLGNMHLRARVMVEGHFSGQHRSRMRGASVEFADHREYAPGDDTRHLDWKLFARSGRDFVKEFDAETNLLVYIILDVSRSMAYPAHGISKLRYGAFMAAGVAYLTWKQRDAPGLFLIDDAVREARQPRTQRGHLGVLLERLDAVAAGGQSNLAAALGQCAPMMTRRGLVVLISDLWAPVHETVRALRYFRHRGHDVLVLHVMHPDEVDFPFRGAYVFVDGETGLKHPTEAGIVRRAYLTALKAHLQAFREGLRAHDMDYHLCLTSDPFDLALAAVLGKRQRPW